MANFKEISEFSIFQIFKASTFLFPRKICLFLGRVVGIIFFLLDKKHRRIAISNLKIAFGLETRSSSLKRIARNSFKHFGELLMDIIKVSHLGEKQRSKLINVEGEENLSNALREGKGVILFSAHYGNWEIASSFFSILGSLQVIARPLDNSLLERELSKYRANLGAKIIYKYQAAKQILQSLREKEMVAFLIDQNVLQSQAVFVDFFGKKAATTPSLAAFYLRTKSPLVPAFCYPTKSHRYHLKIFNPLNIKLENEYNRDVLKITQICTKIIEDQIRENPDFWLWFHNRWKTKPKRESEGSFVNRAKFPSSEKWE